MLTLRSMFMVIAACAALLLAGCRHPGAPAAVAGGTSFRLLADEAATPATGEPQAAPALVPIDALVPPEPLGVLDAPRYPKASLGRLTVPVTLQLTLLIGVDGRVADIAARALAIQTPTVFEAEFRAAIAAAVARWHFLPGERRHLVPGKSNGKPIWIVTGTEKVESTLNVAFTFSASGSVVSELPK